MIQNKILTWSDFEINFENETFFAKMRNDVDISDLSNFEENVFYNHIDDIFKFFDYDHIDVFF